jgi:hypothetical protein
MPQRVIHAWMIVVGIVGLLLVGVLVLYGADLRRASQTGPRWKRRLLTAALALLSGLGAGLAGRGAAPKAAAAVPSKQAQPGGDPVKVSPSLPEAPQWQRLMATWKEAEEVGSGRRGRYPFDAEGKKTLLAALAGRGKDVDALAAGGLLAPVEAGLLKNELGRLTEGVKRMRPVEMRMATCYKPMPPATWPYYSLRRLKARVDLLARLAEAETIHPLAVRKVLATVEADIRNVEQPGSRTWMLKPKEAEQTLRQVKPLVEKIKAGLGTTSGGRPSGLETTAQWKKVLDAWRFCKPLADSHRSTTAQRKQADQKLAAARQAIVELAKAAAISPAESGLLAAEADTLRKEIYREPPIDSQVSCYDRMYIPPAGASFSRLQKRLPLLRKLAEGGKVNAAVVAKVLPTVRADLATLADPKQTGKLEPQRKARLAKLVEDVKGAIAKIEKMLEGRK